MDKNIDHKENYTTNEVADLLGVTRRAVSKWIERGKIKSVQLWPGHPGSPHQIPRAEVERLLKNLGKSA